MTAPGYTRLSRGAVRDGELGAESGLSSRKVGFLGDSVGSTPES